MHNPGTVAHPSLLVPGMHVVCVLRDGTPVVGTVRQVTPVGGGALVRTEHGVHVATGEQSFYDDKNEATFDMIHDYPDHFDLNR